MKGLFLCHTGADKEWVTALASRLEADSSVGAPITVWFDEWDITHGKSIISAIGDGLAGSKFVGIVLSPALVKADWPTAEWQSQMMDDPLNRTGRILTLLRHRYDPFTGEAIQIPWILKALRRFDFSTDGSHDREYARLLRHLHGGPPDRGVPPAPPTRFGLGAPPLAQGTPDEVSESLFANLLPVLRLPPKIYSDFTSAEDYPTVWDRYPKQTIPPFAIRNRRLYSFFPPEAPNNPFRRFLLGTDPKESNPTTLLSDQEDAKMVVGMLNNAFRQHCRKRGIYTPKGERALFYCPVHSGRARFFQWSPQSRRRTLAKMVDGPKGRFGVHYAAKIRFMTMGSTLRLIIEPAWMFTTDGTEPIKGVEAGVMATKWGGRERNWTVLRNVFMWCRLLSHGGKSISIELGSSSVDVGSFPASAAISKGIDGDETQLERLLQDDRAGEINEQGELIDELDVVASLALSGIPDEDDTTARVERLPDDSQDSDLGLAT